VDRADDQGHGSIRIGGLADTAEPLLGAQVAGQDLRQPRGAPSLAAHQAARKRGREAARRRQT
jgi:hypothetical protein